MGNTRSGSGWRRAASATLALFVVVGAFVIGYTVRGRRAPTTRGTAAATAAPAPGFPDLDAAARAHLNAWMAARLGGPAGDTLSTGEAAVRDAASARALTAQEKAGDATDYGFDILSITSHPLDGGATDFIAFERVLYHSTGYPANIVELYHRDGPTAPWKASDRAFMAANVDLPRLRLDGRGSGHLLSAGELRATSADPAGVGGRYAAVVSGTSARLPAGTFLPGEFTSGQVASTAAFVTSMSDHGSGYRQWVVRPGGEAVALDNGTLSFARLQETEVLHRDSGYTNYFVIQDPKRITYGGLVAPGHYTDITSTLSATIAVVVTPQALPAVVGRDAEVLAVQSQLSPF